MCNSKKQDPAIIEIKAKAGKDNAPLTILFSITKFISILLFYQ